ncbi:MAG: MFS transporter [Chloroflexi bacterium]|nr:MFS transporter [Chloroflexota bacterium]
MLAVALVQQARRQYTENRVLVWICVLIAVNQLGFGTIVPVVPLYAKAFGVSQAAIGLTIGIYGLARFLVNVPSGQVADRIGRRGALAIGGAATVLGNLLCGLAPEYFSFLGARFIAGIGASFVLTACQIVLADISPPERRGRIMAIYTGVFSFAVGAGPVPGGLLAEHFGLAAPFYGSALLGAAVSVIAWFRVPETKGTRAGSVVTIESALPPFRTQLRLLAAQRGFLLISLVSFCAFFARTGALFNIIPVLGTERLGLSPDQIGLGLAIISVMGLGLAYPSGVLVDRYGRKLVIVPATLLTGLAFVVFLFAPSYGWFLAGCAAWSVASGIGGAAPSAYAADMAPPGMNAAAMSTYRMLADMGYVIGPILLGVITDLFGANTALGGTSALLAVAALLFAAFAPETYRRVRQAVPA